MRLLEREHELESLNAWLESAAAGQGCVALVMGEAGIGKTTLLRQFTQARETSARVLWGGCEALFTPHPLAPLYDIARQMGGGFPTAIAAASDRHDLFNLTIDHLAGAKGPTIVIIEDAHWADEATLDLIKFLGRRLQRLSVMLIISYRDDEVTPKHPLCSVVGDLPPGLGRRLRLTPLSEKAVAALAMEAGRPGHGAQSIAHLHAVTGGNPFFVTEALAAADDVVPSTVRDAVIARMARLSDPARAIVNLVALVPGKTERWLLDRVIPDATMQAFAECLAIGMVVLPDGALAFRHELARRAAEAQVQAPERRHLHARILAALLERAAVEEVPAARLVHHADEAGDSAAVLRFAPVAAERAATLRSHREAAAHFATALRHAGTLCDVERATLYERRAFECYVTEQIAEAIAARQAALALRRTAGDRLKEGDNLRWLSRLSWFSGDKAASDRYATEAISVLEALPPGRELAMAYSNASQLQMLADQAELSLQWGDRAIALATELDDAEILCHALNNVGTSRVQRGDAAGRADLERSLKLALDGGFEEHAARAYTNLSSVSVRHMALDRAKDYLAAGIAYCESHDLDSWIRYMTAWRARARLLYGDWQGAADDAEGIIGNPRAATISRIPALVVLALVRARRGDPDVRPLLAEARALALPTGEIQRIGQVTAASAEAAWLSGEPEAAMETLRAGYELACGQSDVWCEGEIAIWLHRCGLPVDEARELPRPVAAEIAGDWRKAAAEWESLGCPYEQALTLSAGDVEPALRQALDICDRLGAGPLAGIVRRKLRAAGVRGIARGAQERTRRNPKGLTKSELKVLGLLVQGCRNAEIARRLFVSEKTAGHHVSAILAKLDVKSRGEAAAAAVRLGLISPDPGGRQNGARAPKK